MSARSVERSGPPGTVDFEGDRANLAFRRFLAHSPADVWAALTEPAQLVAWNLSEARIEPRVGGRVDFVVVPARVHITGRILQWDPPRVFEHEWRVAPNDGLPAEEDAVIRWELRPEGNGTELSLSFRGLRRPTGITFAPGLHGLLDRLAAHLAGAPLPDWNERVREARPLYPSHSE
jgi:uncharacterized protein YndB with AHSA1/START domain